MFRTIHGMKPGTTAFTAAFMSRLTRAIGGCHWVGKVRLTLGSTRDQPSSWWRVVLMIGACLYLLTGEIAVARDTLIKGQAYHFNSAGVCISKEAAAEYHRIIMQGGDWDTWPEGCGVIYDLVFVPKALTDISISRSQNAKTHLWMAQGIRFMWGSARRKEDGKWVSVFVEAPDDVDLIDPTGLRQ